MSNLLKLAFGQLGVKEISGAEHNETILKYAEESGFGWVDDDETPWCSIFVCWVVMKCNLKRSKKANARSWMHIGTPTSNPEPGDVVVFWRESPESWKGHVGFFMGYSKDGSRVYCLGGNQGNQVSISAYRSETVLGFRKLQSSQLVELPDGSLKKGDTGESVKQLQEALNMINYPVGTVDGVFGKKTEYAIRLLQTNARLIIDGVYGSKTRDLITSILNE
ncbi:TIGR02594 family protein [Ekhidna sp.]|uniref:C40 family peptidase n=1 Tax=Ekhidna sp. TaxID=2608089 RepID=UPI0032995212